jgi:hypothetical protein
MDRRSVRRTQRRTLDPHRIQRALELRHQRLHLRHIARLLAAPFSTVARALNHLGLGRLRNLDPKPPVQRYERQTPGDLIPPLPGKLTPLHPDHFFHQGA